MNLLTIQTDARIQTAAELAQLLYLQLTLELPDLNLDELPETLAQLETEWSAILAGLRAKVLARLN